MRERKIPKNKAPVFVEYGHAVLKVLPLGAEKRQRKAVDPKSGIQLHFKKLIQSSPVQNMKWSRKLVESLSNKANLWSKGLGPPQEENLPLHSLPFVPHEMECWTLKYGHTVSVVGPEASESQFSGVVAQTIPGRQPKLYVQTLEASTPFPVLDWTGLDELFEIELDNGFWADSLPLSFLGYTGWLL